uniref:Uncharacterized protein n=1 Tax=Schizaphis graminum TaxID=13262 RepID=A0A2S2PHP9_SCHGA
MQPNETFPSLLSDQMSRQSSSVDQLPYVQSSSVYQPPQDEQTKCQKLGSISSRHFRRIVKSAKEKCIASKTPLLRTSLIPSIVNINSIDTTEAVLPSINAAVPNCDYKLYQKCIFESTKTTLDVAKEKYYYFLCQDD